MYLRNDEIEVLIDEENANEWTLDMKGVSPILEFLVRIKRKKGRKKLRKWKAFQRTKSIIKYNKQDYV